MYPDSYIKFPSYLKVGLDISYRTVQGITRSLSEYIKPMRKIHFTHIRMLSMARKTKLEPIRTKDVGDDGEGPTTIMVDSSGISTTKKGPYIKQMWRRGRGKFIRLHIMADRKGKVVGFRVTSERTGDARKFLPLVKEQ
ncbi:MAG: hypothetical protein QXQ46_06405 [Thermoplasmatales archaeon]